MRASRLVALLLLLQARGGMTAAELSRELEVSVRTIHRDVEALGAAGVPVYAERGPHGGIRLVDGYRTRLTGMTSDEAEALFLSGLPGPAAELGLGTVVAAAQLKVLAALPSELRGRATRLLERFHLDASGWFRAGEPVPHLAAIADCVWESRRLEIDYDRGDRIVTRLLDPLGLVLKAGTWYLVAAHDEQLRTYRISRVRGSAALDERARRPGDFDLASYWAESIATYERESPRLEVTIRVRRDAGRWLEDVLDSTAIAGAVELDDPDPETWRRLRVTMEWPREVAGRLLAMGSALEVLEPPELRAEIAELAAAVMATYARSVPTTAT
jgi:predicted DNA-binding transcriptional regulator YafY